MENVLKPNPIDKEVVWDKTQMLMSKTDKFGTIEYANEAFVDVSGYEDFELVGKPHNIIRHPEMPRIIFKVLWDNLKEGNNFHAIIKNLAKSGRYYWMITDYEAIRNDSGQITHYTGRRTSVPDEVIAKHIGPLYKKLLQIESTSERDGLVAAEKYLNGFLEEHSMSYDEYIISLLIEHQKAQNSNAADKVVEKKGFFSTIFNR